MNAELKAAVERVRASAMRRDEGNKWFCDMPSFTRALADEPEVLAALRIDDEVHAADIRDILRRLAEIVK